jgi:hypothetical protein
MLLKTLVAKAEYATIEWRRPSIRIELALATGFLDQNCAAAPTKSFLSTVSVRFGCADRAASATGRPSTADTNARGTALVFFRPAPEPKWRRNASAQSATANRRPQYERRIQRAFIPSEA